MEVAPLRSAAGLSREAGRLPGASAFEPAGAEGGQNRRAVFLTAHAVLLALLFAAPSGAETGRLDARAAGQPGTDDSAEAVQQAGAEDDDEDGDAAAEAAAEAATVMETLTVVAEAPRTFATNVVAEPMIEQQSSITSVLATVDNLPGVSVQEGDTYGFDAWSTSITMRGFQLLQDEAQIGTTIDGIPNGTSDYWSGGSNANRFVDSMNLGGVDVSQGTADIASRSVEALGGTLNFTTDAPKPERTYTLDLSFGAHDGQRQALRVDTGPILGGGTLAWFSVSRRQATDWVHGAARNQREHVAGKVESTVGRVALTGYFSHDDAHEEDYARLFSEAEFESNPRWDRLIADWTGTPWVNQVYRRGWKTPRANTFGYLKAKVEPKPGLTFDAAAYYHRLSGYGTWLPPYLVDVTDDGGGPESELGGGAAPRGGAPIGRLYFVGPNGVALAPAPGCESSLGFPYGGGGPEYDPGCYPANAVPVQTLRMAHYGKERFGFSLDHEWLTAIGSSGRVGNTLRAGVWHEDARRRLGRDWHKVIDARVGVQWDHAPYWRQYDWDFPKQVFKWYVEDTVDVGDFALTAGVKQFLVDLERSDRFGVTDAFALDSDSEVLFSGGVTWDAPVDGMELFAGYSENFRAFSPRVLEVPGRSLDELEPESASNVDFGVRYSGERLAMTATWYDIDFDNRVFFLSPQTAAGPDYVIAGGGSYFNAGGIDSTGVEIAGTLRLGESTSLYTAWTRNDADYVGSGDPAVDAAQGIVSGMAVTGVPETLWVVSLDHAGDVLSVGASAKYTDSRSVTLDEAWIAPDYWLVDAYLTFGLGALHERLAGAEASLVANNLLDHAYLSTISAQGAFLGAPRTVSMNLTVSF